MDILFVNYVPQISEIVHFVEVIFQANNSALNYELFLISLIKSIITWCSCLLNILILALAAHFGFWPSLYVKNVNFDHFEKKKCCKIKLKMSPKATERPPIMRYKPLCCLQKIVSQLITSLNFSASNFQPFSL